MASETPISKANTTFALNLFKTLGDSGHCANVFFSPLSISSALAMVLLGARGNTATQMSEHLISMNSEDGSCEHEPRDGGKIKDLVAKGVVDNSTSLVLVNAIYFKGNWDEPFMGTCTCDDQFWINKNESKPVKMMHQTYWFPLKFISEINCQIIDLPYKGNELSMLIFLPSSIEDGLEKLEQQLTYENFMKWTCPDMMNKVKVELGLPRFKMEENYDLKDVLTSMGMVDAFKMGSSDFSGMSPASDLVLSKVVHKAFVEVNEKGTEAAAATAVMMKLGCARGSQPARFIADHPFLFFIRHNTSNTVLFAGRFCSPK
ncbi:leukocyte elastase inhibitor-like [Boleophthalmus pectinirostris]|uniref:leukocyte elastase inhibitor-like n=1 Tax=Boleophthalmus pectinirostris TaxID=150288 RepID=UPI00242D3EBB|nr:leukocyte elastase inhibitor-like [Boleophthalmus pectinirostris]